MPSSSYDTPHETVVYLRTIVLHVVADDVTIHVSLAYAVHYLCRVQQSPCRRRALNGRKRNSIDAIRLSTTWLSSCGCRHVRLRSRPTRTATQLTGTCWSTWYRFADPQRMLDSQVPTICFAYQTPTVRRICAIPFFFLCPACTMISIILYTTAQKCVAALRGEQLSESRSDLLLFKCS